MQCRQGETRPVGRVEKHQVEFLPAVPAEAGRIPPEQGRYVRNPGQIPVLPDQAAGNCPVVDETGMGSASGQRFQAEGAGSGKEVKDVTACNPVTVPGVNKAVEYPRAGSCRGRAKTAGRIALADCCQGQAPRGVRQRSSCWPCPGSDNCYRNSDFRFAAVSAIIAGSAGFPVSSRRLPTM